MQLESDSRTLVQVWSRLLLGSSPGAVQSWSRLSVCGFGSPVRFPVQVWGLVQVPLLQGWSRLSISVCGSGLMLQSALPELGVCCFWSWDLCPMPILRQPLQLRVCVCGEGQLLESWCKFVVRIPRTVVAPDSALGADSAAVQILIN